jgi:catechol 2,3-dioxygenase-like lactoylglutathione lyase family enzyme
MHSKTQESGIAAGVQSMARPSKLAHFVLRTSRYQEILNWYKTVLGAEPAFENEFISFLTYDDEHHRVAVINMPGLEDQSDGTAGVHHIAFTYERLSDLLENYARLAAIGIKPVFTINHGPTTSLYYEDPDRNQLEFQVENFPSVEESGKFFFSPAFAENPIGVEFDPDEMLRRLRAGESEEVLKKRPDIGARGLSDVKLR